VTFSGLPFLLGFLPLMLAGCVVAGRAMRAWLIAFSMLFLGVSDPRSLLLLLASVSGNYALLHLMARASRPGRVAALGVAADLAVLGWFKLGGPPGALPLGISFFTFTQIACLISHADPGSRPPPLPQYALYAMFFPALIAGPVLNPREMLPQCTRPGWRLDPDDVAVGLGFFVIGLLKKSLVADTLAPLVSAAFADPGALSLFGAWQAACAWSLQLYFDFSGYTDMAIGLAWIVGLRFPDNFDRPYSARCVIDYWQRWHMSLTRFLMAHVHAPLTLRILRSRRRLGLKIDAGAQRSPAGFAAMIAAPATATMLLVALWHGDAATFLVFGLLHSLFLLVNHGWRLYRLPRLPTVAGIAMTYLCVVVAGTVFRAASLSDAFALLAGMAGWHGLSLPAADARNAAQVLFLAALYAVVWLAPTTREIMLSGRGFAWRPSTGWAVAMGGAATLGLLAAGGTAEFVYGQF
jgi:alginate O-acetyltransferase complex protein AlgI